jgi:hypothetical protein
MKIPSGKMCPQQKEKRRRKNPDQKEKRILSALLNIFPINFPPPLSPILTLACMPWHNLITTNPQFFLKQPWLGQVPKG